MRIGRQRNSPAGAVPLVAAALLAVTVAVLAWQASPVLAGTSSDAGNLAVQPSGPHGPGGRDYFVYTLNGGEHLRDVVGVSNLGTTRATFAVYATDALNSSDGSFNLLREEDKPKEVGTWVRLGATQYTLDPQQRVDIPFEITIPTGATPGDHVGAIVAQRIPDPGNPEAGIGIGLRVRVGARVYVRVAGEVHPSLAVEALSISYDAPANPFATADAHISYTLTNTGDVRLSPTAALGVTGPLGLGRIRLPDRQIPELLPGSSIRIAETVHGVRPFVRLSARLSVAQATEAVAVQSTIDEWTVPWFGVGAIVVGVCALVLVRILARRRASV